MVLSCFSYILCADLYCDNGKKCKQQDNCPEFLKDKKKLNVLTRGTSEFRIHVNDLKTWVCNQKMKKVCCIDDRHTDSVFWVPSLKKHECGISIDLQFVSGGENTKLGQYP